MREVIHKFFDGMSHGLRSHRNNPRSKQSLTRCHNLKPMEDGLVVRNFLETIPLTPMLRWPLVQGFGLFSGDCLYAHGGTIYLFSTNGASVELIDIGVTTSWWDFVNYHQFWILSNENYQIQTQIDATGNVIGYLVGATPNIPHFSTCCNFNGQIFAGDILSDWHGMGRNSVVWSKIGEADFNPGISNVAGFATLLTTGRVMRVKKLGDNVIVYTESDIFQFSPRNTTFGIKHLARAGIPNKRAVEGDDTLHIFVDTEGNLWRIHENLQIINMDYQEWLEDLNLANITISMDEKRKEFYITDFQNNNVYLYSLFGLSTVNIVPSSIWVINGIVYGSYISNSNNFWEIVTDSLDYNERALKTLQTIAVTGNFSLNLTFCSVGWANDFQRDRDSFTWRPQERLNPYGQYSPIVSGMDFRIRLYGEGLTNTMNIEQITMAVQYFDRTIIRSRYYGE